MRAFAPPSMSLRFVPVWRRNLLVWRKLAIPSILGNLADPMIYVFGLGYGLGSMLPEVGGVPYIAFLAAGTICFSTMNTATFEAPDRNVQSRTFGVVTATAFLPKPREVQLALRLSF